MILYAMEASLWQVHLLLLVLTSSVIRQLWNSQIELHFHKDTDFYLTGIFSFDAQLRLKWVVGQALWNSVIYGISLSSNSYDSECYYGAFKMNPRMDATCGTYCLQLVVWCTLQLLHLLILLLILLAALVILQPH